MVVSHRLFDRLLKASAPVLADHPRRSTEPSAYAAMGAITCELNMSDAVSKTTSPSVRTHPRVSFTVSNLDAALEMPPPAVKLDLERKAIRPELALGFDYHHPAMVRRNPYGFW